MTLFCFVIVTKRHYRHKWKRRSRFVAPTALRLRELFRLGYNEGFHLGCSRTVNLITLQFAITVQMSFQRHGRFVEAFFSLPSLLQFAVRYLLADKSVFFPRLEEFQHLFLVLEFGVKGFLFGKFRFTFQQSFPHIGQ